MKGSSLRAAVLAIPVLLTLYVAYVVSDTWAARAAYPYDLEWMEGGVLAHAWRVQRGLPLYVEPGPDFIPMVYTPGYYYVLAVLGWVVGLSHTLGRVVSILGTLAACGALIWGAHRRFGRAELGLLGAGVYMGLYPHSGAFFDLVRPDALAVGLMAWAVVLSTEPERRLRMVGAAVLFAAFVVKHNTAAIGFPLVLGIWAARDWREALRFGLAAAVPGLLFTVFMQVTTQGYFLGYIVEVPRSHPMVWNRVLPGTVRETGGVVAIILAALSVWAISLGPRIAPRIPVPLHVVFPTLSAAAAVVWIGGMPPVNGIPRAEPWQAAIAAATVGVGLSTILLGLIGQLIDRRPHAAWLVGTSMVVVAFCVAAMMRGHHGGFVNVFMPWDWVIAAAFVVLLADVCEQLPDWRGLVAVAVVASAQLAFTITELDLKRMRPNTDDVAAGDRVIAVLADAQGPVLSPFAPWMPAQAGHAPGFHLIALWDIRHPTGPYAAFAKNITLAMQDHHWASVLDASESMGLGVARNYTQQHTFTYAGRDLYPRTGWHRRPGVLWVPKAENAR